MTTTADPHAAPHDPHGADGHHEHHPFQAHHFDSMEQQFQSGKLGVWLFLVTEVLFFSGLFVAYILFRVNHPEIFAEGHKHLDKFWGALNTCVLLFSSLTMAIAVRAAQLTQRTTLCVMLALTILCGFGFMTIKYIEYKAKYEHGLLWGKWYHPHEEGHGEHGAGEHGAGSHGATDSHGTQENTHSADVHGTATGVVGVTAAPPTVGDPVSAAPASTATPHGTAAPASTAAPHGTADGHAPHETITAVAHDPAAADPWGTDTGKIRSHMTNAEAHDEGLFPTPRARNVQVFFSIYFCMTGLHGIHVVLGLFLMSWILYRSYRGDFSGAYYGPVEYTGLYWHLVDLVWIFLFPMLYLIQ